MLRAESLACRRGGRLVFRNLSFGLGPGEVLRITGRNGSGKSSLLRVLAGLLSAFDGALSWQNERVSDFAGHRARLRYIGHLDGLKPELTARKMIRYWRLLDPAAAEHTAEILQTFGLAALGDTPVRQFSAGQRRRLALTRLALSDAPLWLLDEPATALDGEGRDILADLISRHRQRGGMAAIATHHDMDIRDAKNLVLEEAAT